MMNYAKKVARIAGIDISIHWTFGLLVAWVLFAGLASGLPSALGEVVLLLLLFGCVLLHELGHAAAARCFGIPTHGITLLPVGGVAQLDRIPRDPKQELVIALAGPAVNVFIVGLLVPVAAVLTDLGTFASPLAIGGSVVARLLWMNVALAVFNLIPAFPMDGGRVLRAILAGKHDYRDATRWAKNVGQVIAVLFVLVGASYNPMLILVALFITFAAEAEYRSVLVEYSGPAEIPGAAPTYRPNVSVPPRIAVPHGPSDPAWATRLPNGIVVVHKLRRVGRERWGWE